MPSKATNQISSRSTSPARQKTRYAVVGLGYIAQVAVLPAFSKAKNSELVALVSDDPTKLKKLSRKYRVPFTYSYDEYDECLNSGEVDAVYIALPNRHAPRIYRACLPSPSSRPVREATGCHRVGLSRDD